MSRQVWRDSAGEYQADERRERDGGGGQPPVKSEVRAHSNTVGRLWFFFICIHIYGFPECLSAGAAVKNPPAIQESWVQFLGREDPLEKEMASPSSILASEISWTEEPSGLQFRGLQKRHYLATKQHHLFIQLNHCVVQLKLTRF